MWRRPPPRAPPAAAVAAYPTVDPKPPGCSPASSAPHHNYPSAPIYRARKGNGGTAGGLGFGGLAWREEAGDGTLSSARHSRSIWWTCSSRTAASAERLSLRADWRPQNISCRSSTRTLARSRNCRCRVDERELLLPDAGWASPPPPAAGSPAIALIKAALVVGLRWAWGRTIDSIRPLSWFCKKGTFSPSFSFFFLFV